MRVGPTCGLRARRAPCGSSPAYRPAPAPTSAGAPTAACGSGCGRRRPARAEQPLQFPDRGDAPRRGCRAWRPAPGWERRPSARRLRNRPDGAAPYSATITTALYRASIEVAQLLQLQRLDAPRNRRCHGGRRRVEARSWPTCYEFGRLTMVPTGNPHEFVHACRSFATRRLPLSTASFPCSQWCRHPVLFDGSSVRSAYAVDRRPVAPTSNFATCRYFQESFNEGVCAAAVDRHRRRGDGARHAAAARSEVPRRQRGASFRHESSLGS